MNRYRLRVILLSEGKLYSLNSTCSFGECSVQHPSDGRIFRRMRTEQAQLLRMARGIQEKGEDRGIQPGRCLRNDYLVLLRPVEPERFPIAVDPDAVQVHSKPIGMLVIQRQFLPRLRLKNQLRFRSAEELLLEVMPDRWRCLPYSS